MKVIVSIVTGILAVISGIIGIITKSPFTLVTTVLLYAIAMILGIRAANNKEKGAPIGVILGIIGIVEFIILLFMLNV